MSLKQSLLTAMSLSVPKVKLRAHQCPKWFTASIQNHLNKVHSLRKKARSTPSPQNLSNLASSESLLQADIAEAKLNYESHLVSTFAANKNYKIFNYMRCLTTHNSLPATIVQTPHKQVLMWKSPIYLINTFTLFLPEATTLYPPCKIFQKMVSLLVRLFSQRVMYMKSLLPSTLTKLWVLMVLALVFLSTVLFHYVVLFIASSLSVFIFTLSLLNGVYTASSLFLNQGTNL